MGNNLGKDEDFCYYSGLPSPMAYNIIRKNKNNYIMRKLLMLVVGLIQTEH